MIFSIALANTLGHIIGTMEHRLVLTLVLFALVLCLYFDTASAQRTGNLSAYKMSAFHNPDINAKLGVYRQIYPNRLFEELQCMH